jgi:hypothetical protein
LYSNEKMACNNSKWKAAKPIRRLKDKEEKKKKMLMMMFSS